MTPSRECQLECMRIIFFSDHSTRLCTRLSPRRGRVLDAYERDFSRRYWPMKRRRDDGKERGAGEETPLLGAARGGGGVVWCGGRCVDNAVASTAV